MRNEKSFFRKYAKWANPLAYVTGFEKRAHFTHSYYSSEVMCDQNFFLENALSGPFSQNPLTQWSIWGGGVLRVL